MHVIAIFQVLIYVGAVMVFMVYVIMLLDVRDRSLYAPLLAAAGARRRGGVAGARGVLGACRVAGAAGAERRPAPAAFGVQRFSIDFLNEYWLHFELISVLLVAAVVAALAVIEAGRSDRG